MAANDTQNAWVLRVLGIPMPGGAAAEEPVRVIALWQDAKEAADAQLNALYAALRATGIVELADIADEIENTLQGFRVGLTTALMNYERAAPADRPKLGQQVLTTVADYQTRLTTDKRVTGADRNPFGVPVTLGTTLGAALGRIRDTIAAH
jgi:hypothetical protein